MRSLVLIGALASIALFAALPFKAAGQEIIPNSDTTSGTLSEARIQQLIQTLEDENERQQFINNLRTLTQADEELNQDSFTLSDALRLDEAGNGFLDTIINRLRNYGLDDSEIGGLLGLLIIALLILITVFANKWLAGFLNRRLNPLRNRLHLAEERFAPVFRIQVIAGYMFGALLFVHAAVKLLDFLPTVILTYFNAATLAQYTLILLVVVLVFVAIWEIANAVMEFSTYKSSYLNNARMKTLLPIARNFLLFVLIILASLMILSELGIDIMPLMAGAGVLGIAIGFGAQALVQDFLTGFIIILEDLIQVGDVVRVGDRRGLIEKITIRKVQLRDLDGTVHTVPFSEINIVDNLTKEYSYYLMDIGVAYREDVDEVIACIQNIIDEMRKEDIYKDKILNELEVLGLDKFADSAIVIKARIKTMPREQWGVGREFNRRMKYAFDQRNIEIPFPHQTIYFGEDKNGSAPAATVKLFQAANEVQPTKS